MDVSPESMPFQGTNACFPTIKTIGFNESLGQWLTIIESHRNIDPVGSAVDQLEKKS